MILPNPYFSRSKVFSPQVPGCCSHSITTKKSVHPIPVATTVPCFQSSPTHTQTICLEGLSARRSRAFLISIFKIGLHSAQFFSSDY